MDLSILFLLVLCAAIYLWTERSDMNLDRPPPLLVEARFPLVYDAVIKAIKTFSYEDYSWFVSYADPDQGYIQAKCRFREQVTSHLRAEKRAIDLSVHLRETESGSTEMAYSFCVTSGYGRVETAHIIQIMESTLEYELNSVISKIAA